MKKSNLQKDKTKEKSLFSKIISLPMKAIRKGREISREKEVNKKRESMKANYAEFQTLKVLEGEFRDWEKFALHSESKIGIILGARGTGKTAIGIKILENAYAKNRKKVYALGFKKEEMPSWIEVVENIQEIRNNSFVLIDEGGVLFSSRKSMTNANKILSDLILVARHKNLNIIFISQNSSNLDVNIIRQADYLILKPSSLLQKDFERKKIKQIYDEIEKDYKKLREKEGVAYIYSDAFRGFVSNPLPSFWSSGISKSFSEHGNADDKV